MTDPTSSGMARAARRRRRLGWGLGLLLALTVLGGIAWYGQSLVAPQPERFAPGVAIEGPALAALRETPLAQRFLRDFQIQAHGASCGPASLRNVLASLDRPVASERALFADDTLGWWRMRVMGMTLDELAALAESTGIGRVQVHRELTQARLRDLLDALNTPGRRLIVNFDREPIHGVALGHFSPIGGYDPVSDRVLLLDVTPGFGAHLVPTALLHAAMQTRDPVSGRSRGLLQIDAEVSPPLR